MNGSTESPGMKKSYAKTNQTTSPDNSEQSRRDDSTTSGSMSGCVRILFLESAVTRERYKSPNSFYGRRMQVVYVGDRDEEKLMRRLNAFVVDGASRLWVENSVENVRDATAAIQAMSCFRKVRLASVDKSAMGLRDNEMIIGLLIDDVDIDIIRNTLDKRANPRATYRVSDSFDTIDEEQHAAPLSSSTLIAKRPLPPPLPDRSPRNSANNDGSFVAPHRAERGTCDGDDSIGLVGGEYADASNMNLVRQRLMEQIERIDTVVQHRAKKDPMFRDAFETRRK